MATNDAAAALPPKDFLVKDYELKVRYLTDHFGRMWTRFNYFVGIESALVGGKLIQGRCRSTCQGGVGCYRSRSLPTRGRSD